MIGGDHLIRDRNGRLVGARGTLDPRLVAQAALPLVGAGRRVSHFCPVLRAFPAQREYVAAPPKQTSKEVDFGAVVGRLILSAPAAPLGEGARKSRGGRGRGVPASFGPTIAAPLLLQLAKAFLETPVVDPPEQTCGSALRGRDPPDGRLADAQNAGQMAHAFTLGPVPSLRRIVGRGREFRPAAELDAARLRAGAPFTTCENG